MTIIERLTLMEQDAREREAKYRDSGELMMAAHENGRATAYASAIRVVNEATESEEPK